MVLEHALPALAALAEASGGDFLSKRLKTEAWPLLAELLKKGPRSSCTTSAGTASRQLLDGDEAWAPAVVRRTRQAVLEALARYSLPGTRWNKIVYTILRLSRDQTSLHSIPKVV